MAWVLLAGVLAVAGLWRARRAALAGDELAGLTLAGLVGVLVSPVSWVHHIVWVFPAMVILTVRLVSSIRTLANDDSGYGTFDKALTARIGRVVLYSVLMTIGLAIWCTPTASLVGVRDTDYDDGGALLALAGSVQLLWLIVVLFVLPLQRSLTAGSARATVSSVEEGGSVPAAARQTRIILPDEYRESRRDQNA
jgi:alpha-1,2-mannosyltransferase